MLYSKFNKYLHDYFFNPENAGETIVFSVDQGLVDQFCYEFKVSPIDLQSSIRAKFQFGWTIALRDEGSIPQIFGLLGIQVFVAHQMHNDEVYTANAYNPRLQQYLNVDSTELQKLYKEHQEFVWNFLKTWAHRKNISVVIPDPEIGSRRYVQFPISQALLNQERLNELPNLFRAIGLRSNEDISFEDFKSLIEDPAGLRRLVGRRYDEDESQFIGKRLNAIFYQIYWFYTNWNGEFELDELTSSQPNRSESHSLRDIKYLILNKSLSRIELYGQGDVSLRQFDTDDQFLFEKLKAHCHHTEPTLIFQKEDLYESWIQVRYLEHGKNHIIITGITSRAEKLISGIDKDFQLHPNPSYFIFEIFVNKDYVPNKFWSSYFSKSLRPLQLTGGLLLSRNNWMLGAGPTIHFKESCKVWLNGQQLDIDSTLRLDCSNYSEGEYRLKVAGFAALGFSITAPTFAASNTLKVGWKLSPKIAEWTPGSSEFLLSGLYTKPNQDRTEISPRAWINAILSDRNEETESIVIKALNRRKNGIKHR